jgi:hypothetical protein
MLSNSINSVGQIERVGYNYAMCILDREIVVGKIHGIIFVFVLSLFFAGCQSGSKNDCNLNDPDCGVSSESVSTEIIETTPTQVDYGIATLYVSEEIQSSYRVYLNSLSTFQLVDEASDADVVIGMPSQDQTLTPDTENHWLYVMAVPFNIPAINMDTKTLERAWMGIRFQTFHYQPLFLSESTAAYFRSIWGEPNIHTVKVLPDEAFLQVIGNNEAYWAIMPFEDVPPDWRILSVDNVYPLDRDLDWNAYALSATYEIYSTSEKIDLSPLMYQNDNPEKMTSVLLTGTTAFVRNLAYEMETQGISYAIENVKDVFLSSDVSHISNEVPMFEGCPSAVPVRREMRFCSSPAYYSLFEDLNISFIELSGNHELDWYEEPFLETLQLYKEHNMPYVGGGIDLKESLQPLELDDHGNHFVFFSCNAVGPEENFATEEQAGSAPCNFERMAFEIAEYKKVGYIPIVLLQHYEVDTVTPNSPQRIDFTALAQVGAVIVSGSQAHNPQTYALLGDSLIHYGLGNTFFDQTYEPNALAILDKHYFYNGKYYNTQIIPIETNAQYQVELMSEDRVEQFLEMILEPMQ